MFWDNLSTNQLLWKIAAGRYLRSAERRQARLDEEIKAWIALGHHWLDLTICECKVCRWSWVDLIRTRYPHDCPGRLDRRLIELSTDVVRPDQVPPIPPS